MEQAPVPAVSPPRRFWPKLAFLLLATACSARPAAGGADANAAGLPPFTATEATLLDDGISPEVFGAAVDIMDPLEGRARKAEGIAPARFATVTRDANGETERYVLEIAQAGPPLKGEGFPGTVTLTVPDTHPSFAFIRSVDTGLVGATVLFFYKRYNQDGRASLHWHIEANNDRVRKVIENARLMSEIGR